MGVGIIRPVQHRHCRMSVRILNVQHHCRAAMDRSAPQGAKIATSEQLQPVFETKAMVQQNTRHLEDISHHLKVFIRLAGHFTDL